MRPSQDYRLKFVTVDTPQSTFGGGFTKKHGSADTVTSALGPIFEPNLQGTANFRGHFSKIVVRIWRAYP